MLKSEKGIVLFAVLVFTCILTILGFSVLSVANSEIILVQKAINKTKAFYLAEAGLEIFTARLSNGELGSIEETDLGDGSYRIDYYPEEDPPYAVATGNVRGHERSVKVAVSFLAPPYECCIYAGNSGGVPWTLILRGEGNPQLIGWGPWAKEVGGRDIVNGNIFVNGNAALYEESSVNPAPWPNTYELNGDVDATGNANIFDSASVSGAVNQGASPQDSPDLVAMNYAVNNTHNVSQIFADEGVDRGYLPSGHELRDVFVKNPTDRSPECATTTGDDYFFEPSSGFIGGDQWTAPTPLHAGDNRVYYIDGDLWVHSKNDTFGFNMDGKVTIVATGSIHICDNLAYADENSMLGLVALGKYDDDGQLISGGNIYFGDPTFGTLYMASAMMFSANDFFYNIDPVSSSSAEPTSGFSIYGNLTALNQVTIHRDWYDKNGVGQDLAAYFDPTQGQWVDVETGIVLLPREVNTLRHYQMKLDYDDRVRTPDTQPPGLPRGKGTIFSRLTNWEEVSSSQ